MSNLPKWNGAATVYKRAEKIAEHLNRQEYFRQWEANKRKPLKKFTPSEESLYIIKAMNSGDEEILKAVISVNRELVI